MDALAEGALRLVLIAFALAFVSTFFSVTHARSGERWRRVARAYPHLSTSALGEPLAERWWKTVFLHEGGFGLSSYRWWVIARFHREGLALSLPPPISIGHPAILIPYSAMHIESYPWYLNGGGFEIKTSPPLDVTLIIDDTLASELAPRCAENREIAA